MDAGGEDEQSESAFLAAYDPTAYPPVSVTVDVVLLTIRGGRLAVLLVQRAHHPHRGRWALPGGFVDPDEALQRAAARELAEETALESGGGPITGSSLEQLGAYGDPGRDPRARTVTVAYLGVRPEAPEPRAGSDAAAARFWAVDDLALEGGPGQPLAFDHDRIVADGVERLRTRLSHTTLATSFVEEPFSLDDLRRVYEVVWGVPWPAFDFRRRVLSIEGFVEAAGEVTGPDGRPVALYRRGPAIALPPPLPRP